MSEATNEEEMAAAMEQELAAHIAMQSQHAAVQSPSEVNLDIILDVPVTLTLEVGRTRLPIRSLLQLNQGSVVELERAAGEPLDVHVNGTLVARGEVVLINEKFGIRLVDVVSPAERLQTLR